ncbi:serine/threonine-protein phosphatase 2A regulatory subunit B'' subunit delta-like isoform X3 [Babylonia areolata]|uniref:serine/threonine-protein phosphatase 2A regulatory subunit B'' subunit delta-like isoform X3 n=1 Tax=Babylonia areolata TaxID=304850 RepID=UPI003FD25CDE
MAERAGDSEILRENLQQIAHGEVLTQPSPRGSGNVMHKPSSPRHRPLSPTLSTSASKLPSPRSPRRPLASKNNHKNVVNTSADGKLTVPNGSSQRSELHHGVLRGGREVQDSASDHHPHHPTPLVRDSPIKDIKTTSRAVPTTTTTTTTSTSTSSSSSSSIVLSSPSSSSTSPSSSSLSSSASLSSSSSPSSSSKAWQQQENKENKPKGRDLPVPRVPPTTTGTPSSSPQCSEDIPPFYFPLGKPQTGAVVGVAPGVEAMLQKAALEFGKLEQGKAYKQQMGQIAKACGFPLYWRILLFRAAGGDKQGFITLQSFSAMMKKLFSTCHDEASKFLRLLARPGRMILEFDDFVPLVQDVVDGHPGLSFLQDAPEFHSRYVHTVISRIFFCVNRSWSGRITVTELRKSNFLQVLAMLEDEEDINQVTEFFSYEHFYVIYCKFWELDKDHDLFIDRGDLARHNDHALNSRIIDRIFSGAVTRGKDFREGRMSYKEFVWFLISEEDKKHPTSIEYWFRCMDLDGDGVISMYEMEYFYEEQMQKMEALGIEKLPFEDCLCQMFDLVRPRVEERITLGDLKNCRMANIFFDTFFNLDKFLEHEQRDPFASARDVDAAGNEISDWDRYAAEEYDILVAEEGMNDQEEIYSRTFTRSHYEDDFEPDDDDDDDNNPPDDELAHLVDPPNPQHRLSPRLHHPPSSSSDDIYDFSTNTFGF